MRMSKKTLSGILVAALAVTMAVGTLAYFSDRATTSATMKTVTNGIEVTPDAGGATTYPDPDSGDPVGPTDPDYLTAKWASINATALANYNPGDKIDLSYTLKNTGDLAIDVRERFVVTSSVAMTDSAPEFRLFTSANADTNGAYTGSGVVGTEIKKSTTKYTYEVSSYTLSSASESITGSTATSAAKNYFLVFNKAAENAFQGATVTIEYVVEAKQHSSSSSDWTTAATATVTLGGDSYNVVPAK